MNIEYPTNNFVSSVKFSLYDSECIKRISVKNIYNPILLDANERPTSGGLYDSSLGPYTHQDRCTTCKMNHLQCPGHFGHIELAVPVYNPLLFQSLLKIYRSMCIFCNLLRHSDLRISAWMTKLRLLERGLLFEAKNVDNIISAWITNNEYSDTSKTGSKEGQDSISTESLSDLLTSYYKKCLQEAEESSGISSNSIHNSHVRPALVEAYRRQIIEESILGKSPSILCEHCNAYNPSLHIAGGGSTKIFEIPLTSKYAQLNAARGLSSSTNLSKKRAIPVEEEVDDSSSEDDQGRLSSSEIPRSYKFLTPFHVMERFKKLWANYVNFFSLVFNISSSDPTFLPLTKRKKTLEYQNKNKSSQLLNGYKNFFLEVIPVPPTKFRPPSILNGSVFENSQNGYLTAILKASNQIINIREAYTASVDQNSISSDMPAHSDPLTSDTSTDSQAVMPMDSQVANKKPVLTSTSSDAAAFAKIVNAWIDLQEQVNYLYDSSKLDVKGGKIAPPGIKQILEKKEGLFRKHMMGKRVNYAARSVISPDVNIETNEIGLPMVFAIKLTYPEPVTSHNLLRLRQAVINGPDIHPGATHIQHEDGTLSNLALLSVEARTALANRLLTPLAAGDGNNLTLFNTHAVNKRVLRHVRDGDVLLLNRQPTLHKPSIMAHRCKVLRGEKTIRMHYANCNTYNADFDGDEMNIHCPQSELSRAEAYLIANTDSQYLVPTDGSPLRGLIQDHIATGVLLTLRDTLLTREEYLHLLYGSLSDGSGMIKILPPCIIKPRSRWSGKQVLSTLLENILIGHPPVTLTSKSKLPGRLFGGGGDIGSEESSVRVLDSYLVTGVIDKAQIGDSAHGLAHGLYELYGGSICGILLSSLSRLLTRFLQMKGFSCRMDDLLLIPEAEMNRAKIIKESTDCLSLSPEVQFFRPKEISPQEAVRNDGILRELDGVMKASLNTLTSKIIDASLPDGLLRVFPHNNMALMTMSGAKGSLVNASQISGALGQQELEGRRVPVMVSGKTLPCFAPLDLGSRAGGYISQRFLSGIRPPEFYFHCMAGREGLIDTAVKTSRSGYLQRCLVKHLESLRVHYDGTVRDIDGSVVQFLYGEDGIDVTRSCALTRFNFLAENPAALMSKYIPGEALTRLDTKTAPRLLRKAAKVAKKHSSQPIVVTALAAPWTSLGSVSESFTTQLESFLSSTPSMMIGHNTDSLITPDQFRVLMWIKYMRSLVEPGEMVGVLAAQSLGEPSTQMTLNTFHFAGFGAKNVTLGIPRLREIVMTASKNIKTPTMMVPFISGISSQAARTFAARATKRTLACCLSDASHAINNNPLSVTEQIIPLYRNARMRKYSIYIAFLPGCILSTGNYCLTENEMQKNLSGSFCSLLLEYIHKQFKKISIKRKKGPTISQSALSSDDHLLGGSRAANSSLDSFIGSSAENIHQDNLSEDPNLSVFRTGHSSQRNSGDDQSSSDEDEFSKDLDDDSRYFQQKTIVDSNESEMEEHEVDDEDDSRTITTTIGTIDYSDDEDDHSDNLSTKSGITSVSSITELVRKKTKEAKELITTSSIISSSGISTTKKQSSTFSSDQSIKNFFYDYSNGVCSFDLLFPTSLPKLFLVPILERLLSKIIVREIPSIGRCFLSEEDISTNSSSDNERTLVLTTEGINFMGLASVDNELTGSSGCLLDMNRLYSNDIASVLSTYGVEAARSVIIKEIASVFAVYAISVDMRHLSLIADYMTFEGEYRPMNRTGLISSTSPYLKMTFESTFGYLKHASLFGERDSLKGPSAKLVMGQVTEIGTGCMDIVQPVF